MRLSLSSARTHSRQTDETDQSNKPTMASALSLLRFPGTLIPKSDFIGRQLNPTTTTSTSTSRSRTRRTKKTKTISYSPVLAKFNLSELLGGRGLCSGEKGIQKELKRDPPEKENLPKTPPEQQPSTSTSTIIPPGTETAFEKELLGLTGGFPGGEKGLKSFLDKNPPPPKKPKAEQQQQQAQGLLLDVDSVINKKPKAPDLPLLLPGMIALVNNPNSPYYMYCGIIQRITDGKAGVLFEGGNWDRLITFRLEELEARDKGPPMVNPRSVILESLLDKEL